MVLLIIGVVLIIVAAFINHEYGAEPFGRLAALLLAIGGLILAIIGIVDLVHASDAHAFATWGTGRLLATWGTGRPI